MQIQNPNYKASVKAIFEQAAFVSDLGIYLRDVGPGWCESELQLAARHLQQDAVVHAGVQATMADHTAGAAAGSLIAAGEIVLTVEFKINLLRPARGERLACKAHVIKPGRTLIVAESEVHAYDAGQSSLVSKAIVTLAAVARSP